MEVFFPAQCTFHQPTLCLRGALFLDCDDTYLLQFSSLSNIWSQARGKYPVDHERVDIAYIYAPKCIIIFAPWPDSAGAFNGLAVRSIWLSKVTETLLHFSQSPRFELGSRLNRPRSPRRNRTALLNVYANEYTFKREIKRGIVLITARCSRQSRERKVTHITKPAHTAKTSQIIMSSIICNLRLC